MSDKSTTQESVKSEDTSQEIKVKVYSLYSEHISAEQLQICKDITRPSYGLDVPSNVAKLEGLVAIFDYYAPSVAERAKLDKIENYTMQLVCPGLGEKESAWIVTKDTALFLLENYVKISNDYKIFHLSRQAGRIVEKAAKISSEKAPAAVNPDIFKAD